LTARGGLATKEKSGMIGEKSKGFAKYRAKNL
jgi:hypothetical protein